MMNKDEAVNKIATEGRLSMSRAEDLYDSLFEKPVVPQYVADWYEGNKENFEINLFCSVCDVGKEYGDENLDDFGIWLNYPSNYPIQTLVNMHQFGYEVEKEKRYTVKLKNKSGYEDYLVDTNSEGLRFYNNLYTQNRTHTRKELEEAGFGWVFSCEGIEVKEVE